MKKWTQLNCVELKDHEITYDATVLAHSSLTVQVTGWSMNHVHGHFVDTFFNCFFFMHLGSAAECNPASEAVTKEYEQHLRSIKMSILLQYYYSVYVQGFV